MKLKLIQLKTTLLRRVIHILSSKLNFFEEVDFLPKDTYDAELILQEQLNMYESFQLEKFIPSPGNHCNYLLLILKLLYSKQKFNFLDFGARDIDTFAHLNKNLELLEYFYMDLLL